MDWQNYESKNKDKIFPFSDLFLNNKLPNIFYDKNIDYIRFDSYIGDIVKSNKLMTVNNRFISYLGLDNYMVPNNTEIFIIKTEKKKNDILGIDHYIATFDPFNVSNCINLKYLIVWVENAYRESEPISLVLNANSKIPFETKIIVLINSIKICVINKITTDFKNEKIKYIYDPTKTLIAKETIDQNYFEFEHLDMKKFYHLGIS